MHTAALLLHQQKVYKPHGAAKTSAVTQAVGGDAVLVVFFFAFPFKDVCQECDWTKKPSDLQSPTSAAATGCIHASRSLRAESELLRASCSERSEEAAGLGGLGLNKPGNGACSGLPPAIGRGAANGAGAWLKRGPAAAGTGIFSTESEGCSCKIRTCRHEIQLRLNKDGQEECCAWSR